MFGVDVGDEGALEQFADSWGVGGGLFFDIAFFEAEQGADGYGGVFDAGVGHEGVDAVGGGGMAHDLGEELGFAGEGWAADAEDFAWLDAVVAQFAIDEGAASGYGIAEQGHAGDDFVGGSGPPVFVGVRRGRRPNRLGVVLVGQA